MYERQKAIAEQAIITSELRMVPGRWHLTDDNECFTAIDGRGCALSPLLIGQPWSISLFTALDRVFSERTQSAPPPGDWIVGAIAGFDGSRLSAKDNASLDGYAWGAAMRAKYVRQPA